MSIGRRSKKVKALAAASALIAVCSVFTGLLSADTTVLISLTTQTSTVNPGDIINFNVNCDTFDYVSEFGPIDVVYDADQFEFVSVTYADVLSGYAFEYDTSEAGTVSVTADFIEVTDEETGLDEEERAEYLDLLVQLLREIDDDIILAGADGLAELVANLRRTHLRLQIIGGNLLRGGNQHPILAGVRLFHAAVEEEGDVSVLLCLRDAALGHV